VPGSPHLQHSLPPALEHRACAPRRRAEEDAAALLARGAAARRVGATTMNRESSRSHSVFTLTLETRTAGASGLDKLLSARLNLVDLAGAPAVFGVLNPGDLRCPPVQAKAAVQPAAPLSSHH